MKNVVILIQSVVKRYFVSTEFGIIKFREINVHSNKIKKNRLFAFRNILWREFQKGFTGVG